MAKKLAPSTAPAPDPLVDAVECLTAELSLLRQVIDEVREDFSWLTRNGLPVQPIEHVHVKQMALDPCAADWGERLEIERSTFQPRGSLSPLDSTTLDDIAEDLKQSFQAVAEGQLEVILTALDGVRGEILTALKRRRSERVGETFVVTETFSSSPPPASSAEPSSSASSPADEPAPQRPPGRLF